MVKRIRLMILFVFLAYGLWSQDMDFGVFNYKGSRLKKVLRYDGDNLKKPIQQATYEYDEKGYLIKREIVIPRVFKDILIYTTQIKYDLYNRVITERFDRPIRKKIVPAILEYYYDDQNRLGRLIRKDGNIYNENIRITDDTEYRFNGKNDIIYIKENGLTGTSPDWVFTPGNGIAYRQESIFKYDYLDDKKVRYRYYDKQNKYNTQHEFYYKNDLLEKITSHPIYDSEKIHSKIYFEYNDDRKLFKTKFDFYDQKILPEPSITISSVKIEYEYDDKSRLIKRIKYVPSDIAKDKIEQVEEYYYEDGEYVYFPYLLPPKIVVYNVQQYEKYIDKDVF